MSATKELREGNVGAWGLLISLILILVSFALPWHTSYTEVVLENDKSTYVASVFNVHFTHSYGSSIVADKTSLYNALGTDYGFNNQYIQYLTYLLPALLVITLLLFAYALFRGEVIDKKGALHILGTILLFIVIVSFVGLYSEFLKYQLGVGFWSSSSGLITNLSSTPDWGFWCLVAAFALAFITYFMAYWRDALRLMLPKMPKLKRR